MGRAREALRKIRERKERRDSIKRRVMRAARHLNRSRMTWVIHRFTCGIDLKGLNKGDLAERVASNHLAPTILNREEVSDAVVDRIVEALLNQENVKGEKGHE